MATKYVMDTNASGVSYVAAREDISTAPEVGNRLFAIDLWINAETPVNLARNTDTTTPGKITHEPPDGGAVFRIVDFKPGQSRTIDEAKKMHQSIGSVHVPSDKDFSKIKHPSMHRTDTLNYMVLISGELWALTDTDDVLLKAGDVLIQKGCMHGWRNDGTETARLLAVLIDAQGQTP